MPFYPFLWEGSIDYRKKKKKKQTRTLILTSLLEDLVETSPTVCTGRVAFLSADGVVLFMLIRRLGTDSASTTTRTS